MLALLIGIIHKKKSFFFFHTYYKWNIHPHRFNRPSFPITLYCTFKRTYVRKRLRLLTSIWSLEKIWNFFRESLKPTRQKSWIRRVSQLITTVCLNCLRLDRFNCVLCKFIRCLYALFIFCPLCKYSQSWRYISRNSGLLTRLISCVFWVRFIVLFEREKHTRFGWTFGIWILLIVSGYLTFYIIKSHLFV